MIKLTPPKVSICIPTYKQPSLFKRTLNSVFIQDYKDYEVIITDDSTDDCIKEIIKEFPDFEKLSYIKNEKRKGSPDNWNEAIDHAKGEYIKILHHDDWFSSKKSLANFVGLLDNNILADFAFSSSEVYGPNQVFKYLYKPKQEQINKLKIGVDYLFPRNFIGCPSSTIYRRKTNGKFDSRLKWVVDLDFYISILRENNNFVFCPEPLVCITEDSPHQVTRECAGDKKIEVFEWIYLYNKIGQNHRYNYDHIHFIYELLDNYNVMTLQELIELGIEPPISKLVESLLFLNRITSKIGAPVSYIKRYLKKPKHNFSDIRSPDKSSPMDSENKLRFFSQFINKGDLCFDIGANNGSKTALFLELGAKVICVEPQESCIQILKKLYDNNTNIIIVDKGVADKEGYLELQICEDANTISTMSENWRTNGRFSKNYKWSKKQLVSVTTLDNLISEFGIPKFCKIDIEGYEFVALKGLTKRIPYISFEFTKEFLNDSMECIDYLLSLGNADFNCSLGESNILLLDSWSSKEKLYGKIDSLDEDLLWGDIYVRFIE